MEKVVFLAEDGSQEEFFIIEQTTLQGRTYLLVTDQEEGDAQAWILKCISSDEDEEVSYEMVEDDNELEAVGAVFAQMLEDSDLS